MEPNKSRILFSIVILVVLIGCALALPRGAHPQDAAKYSGTSFSCGSKTLPISAINDDFCDCEADGSDEPGTSACKNARFYCQNAGYRGQFIYASNVNDGICDCCDGSDEFSSGVTCENKCVVLGAETRKRFQVKLDDVNLGLQARQELSASAERLVADREANVAHLRAQESEQEAVVNRLKVVKEEIEQVETAEREAREAAEREAKAKADAEAAAAAAAQAAAPSPPSESESTTTEGAAAQVATEAVTGTAVAEGQTASSATDAAAPAPSSSSFPYPAEYMAPPTPSHDESAAAPASSSSFPYPAEYAAPSAADDDATAPDAAAAAAGSSSFPYPAEYAAPPSSSGDSEHQQASELPQPVPHASAADQSAPVQPPADSEAKSAESSSEVDPHYQVHDDDDEYDYSHVHEDSHLVPERSSRLEWITSGAIIHDLIDMGKRALGLGSSSDSSSDSQDPSKSHYVPPISEPPSPPRPKTETEVAADKARAEFQEAQNKLREIRNQIDDEEKFLKMDFGPNREFAALYKKCFNLVVRQYTYEVCLFDHAAQKEGHSSTSLGTWTAWKPEDNYRSMRFENGQSCWNGPQRSLTLTLQCGGGETQVLSVDEPGKCVYHAVVSTPAACSETERAEVQRQLDEELARDLMPRGHHLKDEL